MDAVVQVTGVEERFTGWAPGTRAMQIPHGSPSYLLTAFGRVADREFAQERKEDPSITPGAAPHERRHLESKIASSEGRLAKWLAAPQLDDAGVTDRALPGSALPPRHTAGEKRGSGANRSGNRKPRVPGVFQDLLWALLNSKEFLYNH